jgi:hypothetical protein
MGPWSLKDEITGKQQEQLMTARLRRQERQAKCVKQHDIVTRHPRLTNVYILIIILIIVYSAVLADNDGTITASVAVVDDAATALRFGLLLLLSDDYCYCCH